MLRLVPTFIKQVLYSFALLCIAFIPFPFYIFPFQVKYTELVFGKSISFTAKHIFHVNLFTTIVSSDSGSFYILLFLLLVIACLLAIILFYKKAALTGSYAILRWIFSSYLAMQLLKYGADKIFKAQFYLPEPNILFTPLGKLDKDILFWSTMGISRSYNIFLGSTEIIAATLLLFRRTRLAGALLAIAILCNIVAINFSYDISVKGYSLFLLLLATILAAPFRYSLWRYFVAQRAGLIKPAVTNDTPGTRRFIIQTIVIGIILFEAFYPYIKIHRYNDDVAAKPFLHGAYRVQADSLQTGIKKFFIHREGYIIFQDQQDAMTDYKLQVDSTRKRLLLNSYQAGIMLMQYDWNAADSVLTLRYTLNNRSYVLRGKQLNWKALPALQHSFHWVSDGIQ